MILSDFFIEKKLARRKKVKEEAHEKMEEAKETGDLEEALKQKIRTVSITSKMKEDAKKMLALMGMPVIEVRNFFLFKYEAF